MASREEKKLGGGDRKSGQIQLGRRSRRRDTILTQRNIVFVGIDGTGQDGDNPDITYPKTNIYKLVKSISKESNQQAFYVKGVGVPDEKRKLSQADILFETITGKGTLARMKEAYEHFCSAYKDNNTDLVVSGYSRGGAAALFLARLMILIGILPRNQYAKDEDFKKDIDLVFDYYTDSLNEGTEVNIEKSAIGKFARLKPLIDDRRLVTLKTKNVSIKVYNFDPVAAIGVGEKTRKLFAEFLKVPTQGIANIVQYFAANEDRAPFKQEVVSSNWVSRVPSILVRGNSNPPKAEPLVFNQNNKNNLKQRFLPGCHGHIGGGDAPIDQGKDYSVVAKYRSEIVLALVMEELQEQTGLQFKSGTIPDVFIHDRENKKIGLKPPYDTLDGYTRERGCLSKTFLGEEKRPFAASIEQMENGKIGFAEVFSLFPLEVREAAINALTYPAGVSATMNGKITITGSDEALSSGQKKICPMM